ncbi:unnamed protein product [Caenorhabditis auriculariae]|uniref:Uncharacterized protein n=1 Tax=Caenorhabditis auriculariae TaxID=2777116 RepID=A0A8S1GQ82_9PELO|nr:unnamed protein product [Caenorhabditis auriculariae]
MKYFPHSKFILFREAWKKECMIACAEEVQSCVAGDFGPLVIPIIRQPIQPADDVTLLESFKNFVQRSITVIRFIVWIVTTLGEYVLTAAESLANGASRAWSLATYLHSLLSDEVEPSEAEKQLLRSLQDAIADERERVFHEMVRENLICGLLFMAMYFIAFGIISKFKRKTERESLYAGLEDEIVYRMSVWMCSVAVAVSVGSITLLPFFRFSASNCYSSTREITIYR